MTSLLTLTSKATPPKPSLRPLMYAAYDSLKDGTLYRKYAQANPKESARIDAYWNGGARTTAATPTGLSLVMWADVYRSMNG